MSVRNGLSKYLRRKHDLMRHASDAMLEIEDKADGDAEPYVLLMAAHNALKGRAGYRAMKAGSRASLLLGTWQAHRDGIDVDDLHPSTSSGTLLLSAFSAVQTIKAATPDLKQESR